MASAQASKLRAYVGFAAAVSYVLFVWFLSSRIVDFAILRHVPFKDKGIHFLEYGALSTMLVDALSHVHPGRRLLRAGAGAVWLTLCAGLMDELHQAFVFGRSGEVPDLIADACGALSAVLAYAVASAWRRRRKVSPP
jgi:VanZ family protein